MVTDSSVYEETHVLGNVIRKLRKLKEWDVTLKMTFTTLPIKQTAHIFKLGIF